MPMMRNRFDYLRENKVTALFLVACVGLTSTVCTSFAQSTNSPAADWNGNYGFSSTSGRNLRLLQADIIEKKEQGYYDSIGQTTLNVTNNSTTINNIGQQTTSVGVINNSTNNIDIRNSNNVNVDAKNTAISHGCQDSTIRIDSVLPSSGTTSCN